MKTKFDTKPAQEAVRAAFQVPQSVQFWDDVEKRLEGSPEAKKQIVKPRPQRTI